MTYIATKVLAGILAALAAVWLVLEPPRASSEPSPTAPAFIPYVYGDIPVIPPTVPETTTIPKPPTGPNCDLMVALAGSIGWPQDQLETLRRVGYRESRCTPNAHNTTLNKNGSTDYGYLQINDRTWCLPSKYWPQGWLQTQGILDECSELFDPVINLRASLAIYLNSGWTPWRTY